MTIPNWVKQNPDRLMRRLIHDTCELNKFPNFCQRINPTNGYHHLHGKLVTRSNNVYTCKIYLPHNYPYGAPISVITDNDVVQSCIDFPHSFHNRGLFGKGIELCIFKDDPPFGFSWKPDFSIISLILWTAEWLHAYEVKKQTGKWILPE